MHIKKFKIRIAKESIKPDTTLKDAIHNERYWCQG